MTTEALDIAFLMLLTVGWLGLSREVYLYIKETLAHKGPKLWDIITSGALVCVLAASSWFVILSEWIEIMHP